LLNFFLGLSARCHKAPAKASSSTPPRYLSIPPPEWKYENLSLIHLYTMWLPTSWAFKMWNNKSNVSKQILMICFTVSISGLQINIWLDRTFVRSLLILVGHNRQKLTPL
jgi:hypothetical protein